MNHSDIKKKFIRVIHAYNVEKPLEYIKEFSNIHSLFLLGQDARYIFLQTQEDHIRIIGNLNPEGYPLFSQKFRDYFEAQQK